MTRLLPTCVLLALLLCLPISLHAQVAGQIRGAVVDQGDSSIPGASISVRLPGGERDLFTTRTADDGNFSFPSVPAAVYDVVVDAPGFQIQTVKDVKVEPGRDTVLAALKLQVQTVRQAVDVVANALAVETSETVIASTITNQQFQRLPMLNRSPLALIDTQAGVSSGRGNTVINGMRVTYANVTLDGINIQDNFLRENSLNFNPNLLLVDQISEVSITTSNGSSAAGFGGAQVSFVTRSGTNQYAGAAYWTNRNSALAANDWFNNRDRIPRPQLNQNQGGVNFAGPIIRDRLTFFTDYELLRLRQKAASDRTILTADARQGIFTYRDTGGTVQKVNVLQAMNVSADPATAAIIAKLPTPDKINQFRNGDSSEALLRNTAGYSFVRSQNRTRDNVTVKLDFHPSTVHSFAGTYAWNRDIVDRPDVNSLGFSVKPEVSNDSDRHLMSLGWRWNPSPTLTNEVRGGFNFAPAAFLTSGTFGNAIIAPTLISNPINTFRAQGRNTRTVNFSDSADWIHGSHNVQFGFQMQRMRTAPYNDAGITPTYTLGIGTGNTGLTTQLPGISAADLTAANSLLALLAGYVTSYSQTFNINDRTSGFVPGVQDQKHFSFDQYGFYLQDKWRALRRLTFTGGLRYDYFTVVNERDSLALLPKIENNDPISTLLSNATLDFAGKSAGRPWYNKDLVNFAPNVGLVWDIFGTGRMSLRSGYSLFYVNDAYIVSIQNSAGTSGGLSTTATGAGLSGRVSTGLPPIPTPTFKVPRTASDNWAVSTASALALPSPELQTPYVQEWNLGLQFELQKTVIEARYVGNHSTGQFRGFDYNQVIIRENGFLDDFNRALTNGNLSRTATGTFNPAYTGPGTQPLTVFPQIGSGGLLTNATVRTLIEQGQVGELAALYQTNRLTGNVQFFRNPFSLGTNIFSNAANSNYHSLQMEARRRVRELEIQANYTFSKVLANTTGTNQSNFEALLDNANPQLERGRAPYDLTHSFKANGVYDLPAGEGHRLSFGRYANHVLGGWSVSSILSWQSGVPFSINSARGTVNRAARSASNTANSPLTREDLNKIVKFRMASDGPYVVAASAIGTDGRGVAPDGSAPFSSQVFFHPVAGANGSLERRSFNGPSIFAMDFSMMKRIPVRESDSLEVRLEAFNLFNTVEWNIADQTISSTNFGKITSTFTDPRRMQLSLHYRFK